MEMYRVGPQKKRGKNTDMNSFYVWITQLREVRWIYAI